MKLKEMLMKLIMILKNFFTLDVRNHEGFTLVELIIVIAILAILSSVAVVGYSSYVEKANVQADKTLVAEIQNALILAYYSGELNENGYVILSSNGAVEYKGTSLISVLANSYGDNWNSVLKLKYNGWKGATPASYAGTDFYGEEKSLLGEVNKLTGALGSAYLGGLDLGDFGDSLGDYGLEGSTDQTAISNAAVLYVAQKTAAKKAEIKQVFAKNITNLNGFVNNTFTDLKNVEGVGDAAALAAIYAFAEGFAQYCDNQDSTLNAATKFHTAADFKKEDGSSVTDTAEALNELDSAFNVLGGIGQAHIQAYMAENGPGMKNLDGYLDIMVTVNDNKDTIQGNLSSAECFTDGTVETLLNGYAAMGNMGVTTVDGQVAIAIVILDDGTASTFVLPLELNK